ncbi:MAG: MATE family efflux transporter [Desulfomonilaceae bacterium]
MGKSKPERLVSKSDDYRRDSISGVKTSGLNTGAGGYREVIRIALPLVLSTASLTLMLFVDRMFLSWHGQDSVAAATPGGITYFTICSLFLGTAQYVNTIVAQYHGSGDKPACARAVWQGVFFSVAAAPLILASIPIGKIVFRWSGHGVAVGQLETEYFSILMVGGVVLPFNAALSSFFSGRGRTAVVMWGNLVGNAANFVLAYVLIFGKLGFPEMGIRGAGLATAITGAIPGLYWSFVFLSPRYQATYRTRKEFRWDPRLFSTLLRYGVPSGVQFFLDIASFTMFILLVGRLGEADLAATNIALSIEMLAFLPMVGMSIATATLVGEYIGRGRPEIAQKSVYSALKMAMAYTAILAVLYLLVPGFLLELFRPAAHGGEEFETVLAKGVVLVRLVAIYTLFDTMFIVFSGALKGAGDTRFAMWAQVLMAWIFFVPPVYLIVEYFHVGLFAAWGWVLVYVVALGVIFWLRFRSGYWKTIRIIERFPA